MNNTVTTDGGIEVYIHDIYQAVDSFIATLQDPEKAQEPQVFTALLNTVYQHVFRPQPKNWETYEQNRYHSRQRSVLDYDDIALLDEIWNCYLQLCVKYDQIPTLLDFSVLTGDQL